MLTWDFGTIFVVYGPLVAALLPQYWHEARLNKRQEHSILRRYPVPDRRAVVGQGSAPKHTCTIPLDAWYCRAAQCVEMSPGGRSMALLPDASLPCLLSLLEALSAPYLRRHGYGPSPCFRHTAGTLPGLLKRATGAPMRRVSTDISPACMAGAQEEPQGEARRSPRKCTSQERRPTTAVARCALQTRAEHIAVKGMCRNVAGCMPAWMRVDTAGSSGPARKMLWVPNTISPLTGVCAGVWKLPGRGTVPAIRRGVERVRAPPQQHPQCPMQCVVCACGNHPRRDEYLGRATRPCRRCRWTPWCRRVCAPLRRSRQTECFGCLLGGAPPSVVGMCERS
ncbi:hypothetical protein B0H14DRAFT_1680980 [Mycena olivaceomarginata]|nr:hypothetical protein B0H14DRAFT_1680980 [Mycena olivaceomarginata]